MRHATTRIAATALLALTAAALSAAVPTTAAADAAAAATRSARCDRVAVPVPRTAGAPDTLTVSALLCVPRAGAGTLQVLIPGGTYGSAYWHLRGDWRRPSYAEAMTAAGHATLALDRFGSGASSAPPSAAFAADTQEAALLAVLRRARTGLAGHRFAAVVGVGHSYGSTLARTVAVRHPGALDALVLTGEASHPAELPWDRVVHPVTEDPRLRHRGLDAGYYTTRPGARGEWFYDRSTTDRAVLVLDELTKQPDVYGQSHPPPAENAAIRVPVLVVVGAGDRVVCGPGASDCTSSAALFAQEKPFYPNAVLDTWVIAGTGHSLNLHRTAPDWYPRAAAWLEAGLG